MLPLYFLPSYYSTLINGIITYVSNKEFPESIKNELSCTFVATNGVPQGSHHEPINFYVFINYATILFTCAYILMFAYEKKILPNY